MESERAALRPNRSTGWPRNSSVDPVGSPASNFTRKFAMEPCQSIDVMQYGKQANGSQRYRCNNTACPPIIFRLHSHDKGRLPALKQQIVDMTPNGSDVRDIVCVLGVSAATVIDMLKKKSRLSHR
jgi:transposase-like protein